MSLLEVFEAQYVLEYATKVIQGGPLSKRWSISSLSMDGMLEKIVGKSAFITYNKLNDSDKKKALDIISISEKKVLELTGIPLRTQDDHNETPVELTVNSSLYKYYTTLADSE